MSEYAVAFKDGNLCVVYARLGILPMRVEVDPRDGGTPVWYVPERRCRNLSKEDDVFICSECQNETHGFMVDDFGCTVGFGKVVRECPNCGSKVM